MNTTTGKRKKDSIQKVLRKYSTNEASDTLVVRERTEKSPANRKKRSMVVEPPTKKYLDLIRQFPLRPIKSKKQHRYAMKIFSELMRKSIENRLSPDEDAYFDVLSKIIGEFEDKTYVFGNPTEGEMLEFMMAQHGLRQTDLVSELGSQTTVSLILRGKRKMTREQIEKISKRFHISPAVFFE